MRLIPVRLPDGSEVTLTPGGQNRLIKKIVEEFNTSNPYGITVTAEYQGGYNDIYQKMLALLGTSDTPNIVVAYQNQAASYQLVDGLVDMNPLVDSPKWGLSAEDQADFFPGFWQSDVFPSFGGERLGIAPNRSMEMLYYNADWLKELRTAGLIDFDGPPTTPAQFEAAACAASKTPFSKSTVSGSPFGYELSIDASRFASFTFAFGGNVYAGSGRAALCRAGFGELTWNSVSSLLAAQGLFAPENAASVEAVLFCETSWAELLDELADCERRVESAQEERYQSAVTAAVTEIRSWYAMASSGRAADNEAVELLRKYGRDVAARAAMFDARRAGARRPGCRAQKAS